MGSFGAAQTGTFLLQEASVFIGPQASLYKLGPSNLIGLVKNFTLKSDTSYVELTQGVLNLPVASQLNKNTISATMEAYEYTSKNLAYSLGLDGSQLTSTTAATNVSAAIAGTTTTPVTSVPVASATGLAAGNWVLIQGAGQDQMYFDKIVSINTNTLTLTYGIPDNLPANSATVRAVNSIALGSTQNQPYLSARIVSQLADGTPIGVNIPKIRISKGFSLALTSKQYGNLPFEFTVYQPVASDPFYADFTTQSASLFTPT